MRNGEMDAFTFIYFQYLAEMRLFNDQIPIYLECLLDYTAAVWLFLGTL